MLYSYEAAPVYQFPRSQATTQDSSAHSPLYTYPAASSSAGSSQSSTGERWRSVQSPAIHYSPAASPSEVRFAAPNIPAFPYLYPGESARVGRSPLWPDSMYTHSPHTPPLSYTTPDFEDNVMELPETPPFEPCKLESENELSLLHDEIDCIRHEADSLVRSYRYPTELDFERAPSDAQSAPGLSYTEKNRPFLEHNQKLEKLQARLDAIDSCGNEDLRKARRAANAKVERALDELRRVQAMLWRQWVNYGHGIDRIRDELDFLVRSYHYPTELDFEQAPSNAQSAPRLSYTAKNRPFLEHNQRLEKLQARLDAIESHGNEDLRKARKEANVEVEDALDGLKRIQQLLWRQWVSAQRKQRRV